MNAFRFTLCLLLILLNTYAAANITIDGDIIYVETNNYKVQFDYGVITYLHNKLTDETYTLPLERTREIFVAIMGKNYEFKDRHSQTVETHKINADTAEVLFQKGGNEIRLVVAIDPNTDDLLISGDCVADTPGVYAIQWAIDNLNIANLRLIIPSKRLQVIDNALPIDHREVLYPSDSWEAQLAIVESKYGGFYLRSKDTTFQFKNLVYQRHQTKFGLNFRTQNQAPWDMLTTATSVTWRLNTYTGDWCVPAQMHRDWMEGTFDPWRLSDVASWVSDIGLVVIHSTLNAELLPFLAEVVAPTKTLLYLTDWRKEGHDVNHPDFSNPHERFEGFLETARRHGFRVMLHVNIHNCSPHHPLYSELQRFHIRNPGNGELSGWRWDEIDNPQRNAHINLASSKFRNHLVQQFTALYEKYNIDAFHLDVSHYVANDANGLIEGLTSAQANVLMHKELVQAMPGVVLGGEGLHEVTFFRESFAQRSQITGAPHPISTFLFSPYTYFYGGLGTPGTPDSRYLVYLETAEAQGYLPTFWINNKNDILKYPFVQQILSVVRRQQDLGLQPKIDCTWGPNVLFQYTTQTGETVTHQRSNGGSVLIMTNPDLNRDGKVNILDLILISKKLGQQVPQATLGDLNGDGVINLLDLTLLGEHMSSTQ